MEERYAKRIAIYDKTANLLRKVKAIMLEEGVTSTTVITDDQAVYEALKKYTGEG